MSENTAWRINSWLSTNVAWIPYGIVSLAVFLQHFPLTEPLAVGLIWISGGAFGLGILLGVVPFKICNPIGIYVNLGINVLGLLVQIYLVVFHWSLLLAIDQWAHGVRERFFGHHLILGWLVWVPLTVLAIVISLKRGCIFRTVGERPW